MKITTNDNAGGQCHVPFKGSGASGAHQLNILWEAPRKPVFVMDNHRAAAWCWWKTKPQGGARRSLLHIDRHADSKDPGDWQAQRSAILRATVLNSYLGLTTTSGEPLLQWDNYLSAYGAIEGFDEGIIMTHGPMWGNLPSEDWFSSAPTYPEAHEIPNLYTATESSDSWIMNLDLDYLVACALSGSNYYRFIHRELLEALVDVIDQRLVDGSCSVCTIALSPDCCASNLADGWTIAVKLLEEVMNGLGMESPLIIP